MFGRRKKKPEKTFDLPIQIHPNDIESQTFFSKYTTLDFLSEIQFKELFTFLTKKLEVLKKREKLLKEFQTTNKRERQLQETKQVVYSLRETDRTSDGALNFLKEKLTILLKEQEDLILLTLAAKEKVITATSNEQLTSIVKDFIQSIELVNIDDWEEELDYYRTRFLLQKEQDHDSILKEEFTPDEERLSLDNASTIEMISHTISVDKKQFLKLRPIIQEYNSLVSIQAKMQELPQQEFLEDDFEASVKEQEQKSFTIGKELYALKREQGILSLKTYEIIQTIRSRLLNITGAIASRNFLNDTFNELETVLTQEITLEQKKEKLVKMIARIIRILQKEPAGN